MSKVKGSPKTGGRQKGTKNKRTTTVSEQLDALQCDPIAGMAKIAQIAMDDQDYNLAALMYKELAQYIAAKRKSIEFSGDVGLDLLGDVMIGFRDIGIDTDIIDDELAISFD